MDFTDENLRHFHAKARTAFTHCIGAFGRIVLENDPDLDEELWNQIEADTEFVLEVALDGIRVIDTKVDQVDRIDRILIALDLIGLAIESPLFELDLAPSLSCAIEELYQTLVEAVDYLDDAHYAASTPNLTIPVEKSESAFETYRRRILGDAA